MVHMTNDNTKTSPIQHVVLFSFDPELSSEDIQEMKGMISTWKKDIGLMRVCRFGEDLSRTRTREYQHLLYTEFASQEELDAYRVHPSHVNFMEWINNRGVKVLAFDYYIDESTDFLQ